MGQGLAPAEPATSAAASCLLRRRRRAIGAIVVCGPSLGCPFDECGAHRVRRRTCLPSAFDMNAGLKFGFGGHRQIVPRFRRTSGSGSGKRALPHCERQALALRTPVAAFSQRVSLLGERNAVAQHILTIRTVSELGSDACAGNNACSTKGLQAFCTNRREARGPSTLTAARRCHKMLASTSAAAWALLLVSLCYCAYRLVHYQNRD